MSSMYQLLAQLIGRKMSSVEFVQDYIQLRFDGITVTAINPLFVEDEVSVYKPDDQGYRDQICSLIGYSVKEANIIEDVEVRITFSDLKVIAISLRAEDYSVAEGVIFTSPTHEWWVL